MAYTLTYSGNQTGGNTQIEVPDGSSYSLGNISIPGRNFNGYGQPVDQNMLSMLENFASSSTGPSQPLTGQMWYDASVTALKYNISTGNTVQWVSVPQLDANGNATFGNLTLTGNLIVDPPGVIYGNGSGLHSLNASNLSTGTVPAARLAGTYAINVTGNLTGNTVTANNFVGGNFSGNAVTANTVTASNFVGGNISGNFMGNITGNMTAITTGANTTPGTITGAWTLTSGSTLEATYADLAERHHSDGEYPVGTVMTVGGANEVTAASVGSKVLGVVSNAYAYLMNSTVGDDITHPAVAYVGRVPVRVTGPINRHDVIVATLNGCARAGYATEGFGWALETNTDDGEKLILCIIK